MGFGGRHKSGFDFLRPIAHDQWTKGHYARPEQPGGASGPVSGIQSRSARAGAAGGLPGSRNTAGKVTRQGGDAQNGLSVDQRLDRPGPCRAGARCGVRQPHSPALGGDAWRSAGLAPTNALGWAPKPRFRAPGTHNPPRMASQIAVSRRLVPRKPLAWRHKSPFRVVWRPQIPSGGDANCSLRALGAHKPALGGSPIGLVVAAQDEGIDVVMSAEPIVPRFRKAGLRSNLTSPSSVVAIYSWEVCPFRAASLRPWPVPREMGMCAHRFPSLWEVIVWPRRIA
jgi:hypothetical protein